MKTLVDDAHLPSVVDDLLANVRPEDVAEWERGLAIDFPVAFKAALEADKEAKAVVDDKGRVLCVWGGFKQQDDLYVWLVATVGAEQVKLAIHRHLKEQLKVLHKRSKTLVAVADSENTKHHEWLLWLGFKKQEETWIQPNKNIRPHKFIVFRRFA